MKTFSAITQAPTRLLAVALLALSGFAAMGAGPAINGWIDTRPLTPQDIKDYGLTGRQGASGLANVGFGQPAYLDANVNIALPGSNIVSINWSLSSRPVLSAATLAESPLGTNVPVYKPSDRLRWRVADRRLLLPDVEGSYTVTATITTTDSGTTNLTTTVIGAKYMGLNVCVLCHGGNNFLQLPDIATPWSGTPHADKLTREIDGHGSDHFGQNCLSCHTVGYDLNTNAVNDGFDDIATQLHWTFPSTLTNGNWAAMPQQLKNLGNIQCENCHGPGSYHFIAAGVTNSSHWPRIGKTFGPGDCGQCHDSKNNHIKNAEWVNSRHAIATRTPSGPTRFNCVRCHTAMGFEQFIEHAGGTNAYATNTVYEAITCAACHDPHDATNPHHLRSANVYTLPEGTTVTNVGLGGLCMECHHSRNGAATNNIAKFQLNQPTWAGGVSFGVHDSTAGDMIEGVNGITYGKFIPSGAHSYSIENVCVGCHMQTIATNSPNYAAGRTKAGGHSFSMTYLNGTNTVDLVDVCVKCHGPIQHFDMVRKDYSEDGVIEGIQTEVQRLLDRLNTLLPDSTYRADGNYVADGLVNSVSAKTNWPVRFLNAAWNWQFVNVEGSHGIHNAPYAIGLLKASIADLTDDLDHDGLSDTWENANFGSITANDGNDDSDHDGVINSLELAAGTNPKAVDSDGDGFSDLAELQAGSDPTNGSDQPGFVVKIFTAGELEFASEVGKTYVIQGVSAMHDSWVNVTTNIPGTGEIISHLVSTRNGGDQAFYRVVQVP